MHKNLWLLFLVGVVLSSFLVFYNLFHGSITGFLSFSSFNVSVLEKLEGQLILSYQPQVQLGSSQSIYSEFLNIGTDSVTAKIEDRVYSYVNGSLEPLAYYYDSTVFLYPGDRHGYGTTFVPSSYGLYYIQSTATYNGTKIIELWGAFIVPTPQTPTITIVTTPPPSSSAQSSSAPIGPPQWNFTYPDNITAVKGFPAVIDIAVKNTGPVTLHNLKLYISTSNLLNFEMSPKQISDLAPGEQKIFLISIDSSNTPEGTYSFDFQLLSDELKDGGSISIAVVPAPSSREDELNHGILNAELLIAEVEKEILDAYSKGFDVTLANNSLTIASTNLENAKNDFASGDFNRTDQDLGEINQNLQDAVFQLASTTMYVYKPAAFSPLLVFLIILIIIVATVITTLIYRRRNKDRRPKILRELGEIPEK